MSTFAVRYSQAVLGSATPGGPLSGVLSATVTVRRNGVATTLYANKDKAASTNPVPTGVAPGAVGLDTTGNLVFWSEPGDGIDLLVTAGGVSTPVAVPTLSDDPLEGLHKIGNETAAGEKVFTGLVQARARIIVRGSREVDPTDKGFAGGADPTGVVSSSAAFAAAKAAMVAGGRFFIPAGTYKLDSQFLFDNLPASLIEGQGNASKLQFNVAAPITDAMRIVDCGRLRVRDFLISAAAGSAAITRLFHLTTTGSAQHQTIDHLNVSPDALVADYGIVIGGDTALDLAETTLISCYVSGAGFNQAPYRFGNGTSGNVLNIRCFGCFGAWGLYGVLMDGAVVQWWGGAIQRSSVAALKLITPNNAPISFDGVRIENTGKLWECITAGTLGSSPITLRNVVVPQFIHATGVIIHHAATAPMTLENLSVRGGVVSSAGGAAAVTAKLDFLSASSANPLHVTMRNCQFDSDNPFIQPFNPHVNLWWDGQRTKLTSAGVSVPLSNPTLALAAGHTMGTGATIAFGNLVGDTAARLTVTTGTTAAAGPGFTVTYVTPCYSANRPPVVQVRAENSAAETARPYVSANSSTGFTVSFLVAPTDSTAMAVNYTAAAA